MKLKIGAGALLILAIMLFTGCTNDWTIFGRTLVRKINVEELSRTVIHYATKLSVDKRLSFEDSRVYYTDCSEKIRLVFASQDILEIKQARRLLVDVVEGLLLAINNNPIIAADLCENPFTSNNLEIYINFESFYCEYVDPFYVGWIQLDDGMACYYLATQKDMWLDQWHSRFEPYYKSAQFVRFEREAENMYINTPRPLPPVKQTFLEGVFIDAGGGR